MSLTIYLPRRTKIVARIFSIWVCSIYRQHTLKA